MGLGKGRKKSCLSVERCGWLNGVWQCVQTNPNGLKSDTAVGRFLLQAEEKSVIFTLLFKYIEVCEHVELEVSTSGVLVGCMLSRAVEVIGFSWTNEVYSQSQSCTHCTAITLDLLITHQNDRDLQHLHYENLFTALCYSIKGLPFIKYYLSEAILYGVA